MNKPLSSTLVAGDAARGATLSRATTLAEGDVLRLPAIVAGEVYDVWEDAHEFSFEGCKVVTPRLPRDIIQAAIGVRPPVLAATSFNEIVNQLGKVSEVWLDRSSPWRALASSWVQRVCGYHQVIVDRDLNFIGRLMERGELYDLVENDLGDTTALDEWVQAKAVYRRALPAGIVTHILVGNVPLTGPISLVRSMLTKNSSVAKVSSRDPVTPLLFANCLQEHLAGTELARSLTVGYWEPESALETSVLQQSNVVSVWGRDSTVLSVKRRVGAQTEVVAFGGKVSFGVVMPSETDLKAAALKVALDTIWYDQEACFSPQMVFVVGHDVDVFAERLANWLGAFEENVARRPLSDDEAVHVHRARADAAVEGWRVIKSDRLPDGWSVFVGDGSTEITRHPLSRSMYVRGVDTLADVAEWMDGSVQTVAVSPSEDLVTVADLLAPLGADRVVPAGRTGRFRNGFVHDGIFPLQRFVRWSAVERDKSFLYKFEERPAGDELERMASWARGERPRP